MAQIELAEGWNAVGVLGGIALGVALALLIVVAFSVTRRR